MGYTCRICKFTHSCWCGGRKCKCWMWLGEARIAWKMIEKYKIEDTNKLIKLIKNRANEQTILNEFNIESTKEIAKKFDWNTNAILDEKFARELGMKSVYCEYESFNENSECIFCGRKRKDGYLKPCLYYIAKRWTK